MSLYTERPDEIDPYKKARELLELSPKGLVPALKLTQYNPPRALHESMVILEYLEDLAAVATGRSGRSLLPPKSDPYTRALVRLQADHVNRSTIPAFYRCLQAQDPSTQIEAGKDFVASLERLAALLESAEREILGDDTFLGEGERRAKALGLGLWVQNNDLGWTDVVVGPWLFRATNVLKHYRGLNLTMGEKFNAWLERLFAHPAFVVTCSTEDLYLDSYKRYAYNLPNTSMVADAVNSGRPLP